MDRLRKKLGLPSVIKSDKSVAQIQQEWKEALENRRKENELDKRFGGSKKRLVKKSSKKRSVKKSSKKRLVKKRSVKRRSVKRTSKKRSVKRRSVKRRSTKRTSKKRSVKQLYL